MMCQCKLMTRLLCLCMLAERGRGARHKPQEAYEYPYKELELRKLRLPFGIAVADDCLFVSRRKTAGQSLSLNNRRERAILLINSLYRVLQPQRGWGKDETQNALCDRFF
jgi:hypothetical protein